MARALFRRRRIAVVLILCAGLLLAPRESHADFSEWVSRCVSAILNVVRGTRDGLDSEGNFRWKGKTLVAAPRMANWRQFLEKESAGKIESIHNKEIDLLLYQIAQMPDDFIQLLANQPELNAGDSSLAQVGQRFLSSFEDALKTSNPSFLNNLFRVRLSYPKQGETWSQWLLDGTARIRALPKENLETLELQVKELALHTLAQDDWRHGEKYRYKIPYQEKNGIVEITLDGQILRGKRRGGSLDLTVPADRVESHAGNRLQTKIFIEKALAGEGGASYYPASIGWDGKFYLLDRNHRYALRDTTKPVVVRVSFPPTTATVDVFMVGLLGYPFPRVESLVEVYQGLRSPLDVYSSRDLGPNKRSLREIIPPELARRLDSPRSPE